MQNFSSQNVIFYFFCKRGCIKIKKLCQFLRNLQTINTKENTDNLSKDVENVVI